MADSIDDMVAAARSRIGAMKIAPCAGLASSQKAAQEFETAIDALVAFRTDRQTEREFREVVAKVEERFRPVLDSEAKAMLGAKEDAGGGTEGKYEPTMVSTGWWIVLARFGIAMRFGSGKPDIAPGDEIALIARKIPKAKPTPELAVVPDAPKPPSFTPEELEAILELAVSADSDDSVLKGIAAKLKEPT